MPNPIYSNVKLQSPPPSVFFFCLCDLSQTGSMHSFLFTRFHLQCSRYILTFSYEYCGYQNPAHFYLFYYLHKKQIIGIQMKTGILFMSLFYAQNIGVN